MIRRMAGRDWDALEDEDADFPERLTPAEAREKYERLVAEADERGGTRIGTVATRIVDGRRLS